MRLKTAFKGLRLTAGRRPGKGGERRKGNDGGFRYGAGLLLLLLSLSLFLFLFLFLFLLLLLL